jgi:DNA repair protein RAD5
MNKDPGYVLAGNRSHVLAYFAYSAMEVVQVILESVLLRREKTTRDKDGNLIVHLPPKAVTIQYLNLSPEESKIYGSLYKNIKADYDSLNNRGLVVKNMTSILARIMTCVASIFI